MEDIEQHGGLGGKTFFLFEEHSTDIMKTENDNTVAISDYMFYSIFFPGEVEGVVIEVANVDVRHSQQGRLKFLLLCHLYINNSSVQKFSLLFC